MTKILNEAIRFAYEKHINQKDKNGEPYFLHCLRVMYNLKNEDDLTKMCGILHDVVEDTEVQLEEISQMFGNSVMDVIALLTKPTIISYEVYIMSLLDNPIAWKVKRADILDNTLEWRLALLPEDIRKRLKYKYGIASTLLLRRNYDR